MQLYLDEILCNAPPRRRYIACLFRKTGATRSPRANNTLRAADGIQPCGTCVQLNFTRSNVRTAPVMVSVPIWSAALKRFFELLSLDAWAKWNPPLHRALQAPSRCLAANFRFRTFRRCLNDAVVPINVCPSSRRERRQCTPSEDSVQNHFANISSCRMAKNSDA